jgi:hypothetical protein
VRVSLAVAVTALLLPPLAAHAASDTARSGLNACAAIEAADARLACYDKLAGRSGGTAAAPAAPPAGVAAAAAPVAAPVPPKASFGLYSAEHPTAPAVSQSFQGVVTDIGSNANGHATVALAGGQLWELFDSDPVLAVGDTVTIRRAALGSFMLETPSKRTHRARRLH